ncbi:MAG: GH116 family glycosyl hydrolase [Prolixibacteraceae bacterium]
MTIKGYFQTLLQVFTVLLFIQTTVLTGFSQNNTSIIQRNSKGELTETYSSQMTARSGIAIGGIGTGSIELRKDGRFYNWSIFNNWPKETGTEFILPSNQEEDPMASLLFFKVRYQVENEEPKMKLLQINNGLNDGTITGMTYYFPWMEQISTIEYSARFPFTTLKFTDPDMPFDIYLEAYSPFIPYDIKNSSLPVAYFDFRIESKTEKKVDVMLIASQSNTVAYDNQDRYYITDVIKNDEMLALNMTVGNVDSTAGSYGQLCLSSLSKESTYYGGWSGRHPYYEYVIRNNKLPNIDDTDGTKSILETYDEVPEWMPKTNGRNMIDKKTGKKTAYRSEKEASIITTCYGSVAISKTLNGKSDAFDHTFTMAWNFPNKYASVKWRQTTDINEGNYYSNFFNTATEVAVYAAKNHDHLKGKSKKFMDDFFNSTMDTYALEQINSQLNTFITSGRLVKDGYFGVLEGLGPNHSWGPIATIDVSLYGSVPIIALFPELQKSMMRAHKNVQADDGRINHGLFKNFHMGEDETWNVSDRIDLPGQYITMIARDFLWSNDKEYLKEMYPSVLKVFNYVLTSLDKNGDMMPDMEGHRSSYDNFPMYGMASYIQSQWLCAMASLAVLSEEMNDKATMKKAKAIFDKGSKLMDEHLWNGKYYKLYNDFDGTMGINNADEGCLTDQIIGQWAANQSGLGYLFNQKHISTALDNIRAMSFKDGYGLRNASWPKTEFLADIPADMWVDQGNTYWTGVELAFASFLIDEGKTKEGLELVKAVDDRYRKAGLYFDHQEFGGHYYRPMSAWSVLNSMLGFSINKSKLNFAPKYEQDAFQQFFATPSGYGHYISNNEGIEIKCSDGEFNFDQLSINDKNQSISKVEIDGKAVNAKIKANNGLYQIKFGKNISIKEGQSIVLK